MQQRRIDSIRRIIVCSLLCIFLDLAFSQEQDSHSTDPWYTAVRPDYTIVDSYVASCGVNCGKTPEEVADKITAQCTSDIEKARAIFDWLAYYIAYDTTYKITSASAAFKYHKSVCAGYADLFEQMGTHAGLSVITVAGDAKNNLTYTPGSSSGLGTGGGHAWNIVRLTDRDIIVDATWGAGWCSGSLFIREFEPSWFDPHPAIAIFTHIPPLEKYELLEPEASNDMFMSLPYIQPSLSAAGIDPCKVYSFFLEHPEKYPVEFFKDFNKIIRAGIKIISMPLYDYLDPQTEYEIKYMPSASGAKLIIKGARCCTNDDGTASLFFTGKVGDRIVVQSSVSSNGTLFSYHFSNKPRVFSKRNPYTDAVPRSAWMTNPSSVVYEFIQTGSRKDEGFFISNAETTWNNWSAFEKDSSFESSFLRQSKIKKNVYEGYTWAPYEGFTIDQIAAYCNAQSVADGYDSCYSLAADGSIVCNIKASGYRIPTYKEWLFASTEGSGIINLEKEQMYESAWCRENSGMHNHIINSRKPNTFFLYDILGNAPEICFDEESGLFVTTGGSSSDSAEEICGLKKNREDANGVMNGTIRLVRSIPTDAKSEYYTAKMFYTNEKARKNYDLCFFWAQKAADHGSFEALNLLGVLYENGFGVKKDVDKAESCYLKSAEYNYGDACFNLGLLYGLESNGKYDPKKSIMYYEKSAEGGNSTGAFFTGLAYAEGFGTEVNNEKAFLYVKKACDMGYEKAGVELAKYYLQGIGTAPDPKKAFLIYKEAADNGNVEAMLATADFYEYGRGIRQDWFYARKYYREAAEKGNLFSKGKLLEFIYYGRYSPHNIQAAYDGLKDLHDGGYTEFDPLMTQAKTLLNLLSMFPEDAEAILSSVPEGKSPLDYATAYAQISTAYLTITGVQASLFSFFTGISPESLNSKIIESLNSIADGKTFAVNSKSANSSGCKILFFIVPADCSKAHALVKEFYKDDALRAKDRRMNGERYRFDSSLYDYYDIIVPVCASEASIVMQKASTCIPKNSRADILSLDVSLFSSGSAKPPAYQQCIREIWKAQIDSGTSPRLIVLGDSTDSVQSRINALFAGDDSSYANKVRVFGTPLAMTGEIALGFRANNLLVIMLAKPFEDKKAFKLLLDESEVKQGTAVLLPSFIPDSKMLQSMRALAAGKTGTVAKPSGIVMVYSVVKPH
jgi:TPR repeat protein